MLQFSYQNIKIKQLTEALGYARKSVLSFDLPAGYTCPAANICKAFANQDTGHITDSKGMLFRCYAASTESYSPAARRMRWNNFNQLRGLSVEGMTDLILSSIPDNTKVVRIHSSGDFFSDDYFTAWYNAIEKRTDIVFFGYTKMLPYMRFADNLDNFHLVYSMGGKYDNMVKDEPICMIVKNLYEARMYNLPLACAINPADDYFHIIGRQSFALRIHGTQPKKVSE